MKVFVTGGSGFIGSAVIAELLNSGHKVIALARSEESAAKLRSWGPNVEVLFGDLKDLDSLRKGAVQSEGVIHLGFIHDFSKFKESCEIDQKATICMLDSIKGTEKPFIYTSGTFMLPQGKLSDENSKRDPNDPIIRGVTEEIALDYKEKGVRVMSIRLGVTVHGKGDHGFVPALIGIAKSSGKAGYVGDGENIWPAVHRSDAARLFKKALEFGKTGSVYHGVAEDVTLKSIAQVIGEKLDIPVISISPEDAAKQFGPFAMFVGGNILISSKNTRVELEWEPKELAVLDDMRSNYF